MFILWLCRLRPHPREGWAVGCPGVAVHPRHPQAERGGHHEGSLAEIRQELLHQVGGKKVLLTPHTYLCLVFNLPRSEPQALVAPACATAVLFLPPTLAVSVML